MKRFARAKNEVVLNLRDIVPELFGRGERQTRENGRQGSFQVLNKWRHDADMGQMKVWPSGAFKDFAGDARGDAIDLVAYGLTGFINADTRMKAIEWIEDRFGIREMSPSERKALEDQSARRRAVLDQEAQQNQDEARTKARKGFFAADDGIAGTLAETYIGTRGIPLAGIPNICPSFRYREKCDYWPARAGGRAPQFPAMLSAMLDRHGKIGAIHYTFLEPDGLSKLKALDRGWFDVKSDGRKIGKSAKLMFPDTSGLVVRVTRGPTGLTCEEAAAKGQPGWLMVTEGIEDGMTFGMADPDLRVHAAGSLSGYLNVPDMACAKGYLVARDNDWDKPQAVEQFNRAILHFKSFGKPVEEVAMPPEWGKDANDVLNWKG